MIINNYVEQKKIKELRIKELCLNLCAILTKYFNCTASDIQTELSSDSTTVCYYLISKNLWLFSSIRKELIDIRYNLFGVGTTINLYSENVELAKEIGNIYEKFLLEENAYNKALIINLRGNSESKRWKFL